MDIKKFLFEKVFLPHRYEMNNKYFVAVEIDCS